MFSDMEKTAEILKALSDPTRLRIVSLLRHGELCVCDLTEALQIPQSTVSRHLASLKNAGWVKARRSGKWMHYLLLDESPSLQARVADILKEELPLIAACQEDDRRYFTYLAVKPSHACDRKPVTRTP
jgi:ArsR family transcriptional regulator